MRWAQLDALSGMLNTDEAANGLDALSLIESPRLTPFFPSHTGRESGWHYWLSLFLLAFGIRPLAIRLAATMLGIMTLAAVYALGRELLPRRAALWAAAALAVLYWHVHLSQIGFRAILLPLIGSLALAWLLRAHRTNRLTVWLEVGVLLGLLAYTYFSARLWLGYGALCLIYWGITEPKQRQGILLAGGVTAVLVLPLLLYTNANPLESFNRIGEVSVLTPAGVLNNGLVWLRAWFLWGDQNVMLNLPGRPILDWFLGIPFIAGLVGLWWLAKVRWHIWWLAGLATLSIVPSLLSDHAPHFLRAIGLVVPTALVIGAGMYGLEYIIQRTVGQAGRRYVVLLPLVALLAAGINTYNARERHWLTHPDLPAQMEFSINEAVRLAEVTTTPEIALYFTSISRLNPTLLFWTKALAPRPVAAFAINECWVKTAVPALYVLMEPTQVIPFAAYTPVKASREAYQMLLVEPDGRTAHPQFAVTFAKNVQMTPTTPLPQKVQPGDTLHISLDFRAEQPTAEVYSLFIHLYGTPSPYEGGVIWAQTDSPLCLSYPMTAWRPFETINQQFTLSLPTNLPPGDYTLVTGLYNPANGLRLPLTAPAPNEWNHFELAPLAVTVVDE